MVHLDDGVGLDGALGSPTVRVTIGEDFVCSVSRPPSGRSTCTDHTPSGLIAADRRSASERVKGHPLANNASDGFPIETWGSRLVEYNESRVRHRIVEPCQTLYATGHFVHHIRNLTKTSTPAV